MRNQLSVIILCLLLSTGCYAQKKYSEGVIKINNEKFQISYTGMGNELLVVYNIKSKYAKGGTITENPNALPLRQEDIHFDKQTAKAIIQQVFKSKTEKLNQNDDFFNVLLTFERSGKLSDISYGLKSNTLITLKEISEIDSRLRSDITATFTGRAYQDYKGLMTSLGIIRF